MTQDERMQPQKSPSPKEMVAFAREYIRAYLETVEEKAEDHLPPMAQHAPYHMEISLLPNGCYALILESAPETKIRSSFKCWEDLQDIVMKGVDFFIGFFPHEMKSIADWKKRGRKDAIRDIRVLSESQLGRTTGQLSSAIDEISKMAASNPWLAERASEQIQMLRDVEERLRRGFAPVDAIATLQDLKGYKPAYERMIIEFPDKSLLEKIVEGIDELMALQSRMDTLEGRMFEVERASSVRSSEEELPELRDKLVEMEDHLEKFSNILQMLNAKVEKYFSKTAEVERQANLEHKFQEMTKKLEKLMEILSGIQRDLDKYEDRLSKEIGRIEEEIDRSMRRVKRLERHFVEFAKSVEEA